MLVCNTWSSNTRVAESQNTQPTISFCGMWGAKEFRLDTYVGLKLFLLVMLSHQRKTPEVYGNAACHEATFSILLQKYRMNNGEKNHVQHVYLVCLVAWRLEVTCSVELLDHLSHLTPKKYVPRIAGPCRKVAKYVGFSKLWSEDDARALAEPEDQAVNSSLHVFFGGVPVWWFQFDNMNFTWLTNWIGSFLFIIPVFF